MKFYGTGVVWNKEADKALCEFKNGVFETCDIEVINKLQELNYHFVADAEPTRGVIQEECEESVEDDDDIEYVEVEDDEEEVVKKKKGKRGY